MIVEASAKHKKLVIPYIAEVVGIIPDAKRMVYKDQDSLVVPHDGDTTRFVRNLGIAAPAPIQSRYDWNNMYPPPFESQVQTASLLTTNRRAYVLNGMGTGKTKTAIGAFDFLRREGEAKSMLVAAPLSILERVWQAQLLEAAPHLRVVILHAANSAKRRARLAAPADVYIINHDGIPTIAQDLIDRTDIDVLVIDELAVYRNGSAQRTKIMRTLASHKPRVWGMTGSPTPKQPTDAWAQMRIVTPHTTPMSERAFRDMTMTKVSQFRWVAKPNAMDIVHKMMQPAVRYSLSDVVELPDCVFHEAKVTQSDRQQKVYKHLQQHMHALFAAGELTVANQGVLMNKLLQVSMGWVYTSDRHIVSLENTDRMEILHQYVESASNKVIVFVPYIHALDAVKSYLTDKGFSVAQVSGATPLAERTKTFNAFVNATDPEVLVAHPSCMAHGLQLVVADTVVWFGAYPDLEVFDQANARIRRVGQKNKQLVVMLAGTEVERRVYKKLRERQSMQTTLLDMFEAQNTP